MDYETDLVVTVWVVMVANIEKVRRKWNKSNQFLGNEKLHYIIFKELLNIYHIYRESFIKFDL